MIIFTIIRRLNTIKNYSKLLVFGANDQLLMSQYRL